MTLAGVVAGAWLDSKRSLRAGRMLVRTSAALLTPGALLTIGWLLGLAPF